MSASLVSCIPGALHRHKIRKLDGLGPVISPTPGELHLLARTSELSVHLITRQGVKGFSPSRVHPEWQKSLNNSLGVRKERPLLRKTSLKLIDVIIGIRFEQR